MAPANGSLESNGWHQGRIYPRELNAYTRGRMKRRHLHRWAIWLLPLLLLRAFVPTGFMLTADASGLSLVICSGTTTLADASTPEQSVHGHHDHHQHGLGHDAGQPDEPESAGSPQHEQSALCPFAVAGLACSQDIAFLADTIEASAYELPADCPPPISAGPRRADQIRGPPFLA